MAKTDVTEMVNLCKGLGLRVAFEGGLGHYTVRDPDSEAKLFYISSTPSDVNFKYEIARHLRKLGLLKGNLKFGKFRTITRKKKYGPIDLIALRKAQAAAESAGERIPLLSDIEDDNGFLRNKNIPGGKVGYDKDAQQEAIDSMVAKADAPRVNATRQRLEKLLADKSDELIAQGKEAFIAKNDGNSHGWKNSPGWEVIRLAIEEVGPKRDLKTWPSQTTGMQALNRFRSGEGLALWGVNLLEATMDTIDGLQWGKIETEKAIEYFAQAITDEDVPPITHDYITEETLLNILGNWVVKIEESIMQKIQEDVFEGAPSNGSDLRDRYAEKLLALVDTGVDEDILKRLDKLVGLDV